MNALASLGCSSEQREMGIVMKISRLWGLCWIYLLQRSYKLCRKCWVVSSVYVVTWFRTRMALWVVLWIRLTLYQALRSLLGRPLAWFGNWIVHDESYKKWLKPEEGACLWPRKIFGLVPYTNAEQSMNQCQNWPSIVFRAVNSIVNPVNHGREEIPKTLKCWRNSSTNGICLTFKTRGFKIYLQV